MSKDTIFIAIFSVFSVILCGQTLDRFDFDLSLNGQPWGFGLAGGMNLPEFSEVDLDHDGIKDLFVFDKSGEAISAFKNMGENGVVHYEYAPELLEFFPKLVKWALMVDYNLDGAPDIFAYSSQPGVAGVEVHKGHWEGGRLAFEKLSFGQFFDVLYHPSSAGTMVNLYVSSIDIPAVVDVDNDGDMDILTFASNGGYVLYFRNFSQEQGYGADTLIYQEVDHCWGKFYESGLSTVITLSDNPNTCAESFHGGSNGGGSRHAGSTLLALDLDNDGDKELLMGDVSYNNIVLLINSGTPEKAYMTAQDTLFPSNSPIDIPLFPGIFSADLDNDGDQDLVSAPNDQSFSISTQNAWRYENHGSNAVPQFTLAQKDFLGGEMIDFGTGAYPALADIDADGDLDMVIGNLSFYDDLADADSRLFLFENIGNKWSPKFELVDTNYLDLMGASPEHWNFTPSFGDLDGDGDLDLMVGEFLGAMYYFENTAGVGQPMNFAAPIFPFQDIDVGLASAPYMVDVDEDGLVDLIVGERNGNVNFLKNIGTVGAPNFNSNHEASPNNSFWGEIDTRVVGYSSGYSVPRMWKENGVFRLFCGSENGQIFEYKDIESNLGGAFAKAADDFGNTRVGGRVFPEFLDMNNDGFRELVVGNIRGGICAFKTDLPQPVGVFSPNFVAKELKIDPNPTMESVVLDFGVGREGDCLIYDMSGRLVLRQNVESLSSLLVSGFKSGVYTVKVIVGDDVYLAKLGVF